MAKGLPSSQHGQGRLVSTASSAWVGMQLTTRWAVSNSPVQPSCYPVINELSEDNLQHNFKTRLELTPLNAEMPYSLCHQTLLTCYPPLYFPAFLCILVTEKPALPQTASTETWLCTRAPTCIPLSMRMYLLSENICYVCLFFFSCRNHLIAEKSPEFFHTLLFCSSKGIKVPMENCFGTLNCKLRCFHDSSNPSEAEVACQQG